MTKEEALEMLNQIEGCYAKQIIQLANHITELHKQINTLTKPCGACGGMGLKQCDHVFNPPIPLDDIEAIKNALKCPDCNGTGRVPRTLVVEGFAKHVFRMCGYADDVTFEQINEYGEMSAHSIPDKKLLFKLIHSDIPGMWEIVEVNE